MNGGKTMEIARYFDDAILKPGLTIEERREQFQMGIDAHAGTLCVQPCDIETALEMCKGTDTDVICVLDFPQGQASADAKALLAELYAGKGVKEIDMVLNYGYLKSGAVDKIEEEVQGVVEKAHAKNVAVKVIFETSELNTDQIAAGTEACIKAGADFVKTSTGFSSHGATVEAVQTMLDTAKGRIKVKPSGGIRDYATAKMYVDMGASRLGVGTSGVMKIVEEEKNLKA